MVGNSPHRRAQGAFHWICRVRTVNWESELMRTHDNATSMASSSRTPGRRGVAWKINGLDAEGPWPELRGKLDLFGQFVGEWDIVEARYPKPDGTEIHRRGEIHFKWILEGRAVQDVWSIIDEKTGKAVPAGTTVRFYDSNIDAWHSIWISPRQHAVQPFIAREVKGAIVLAGKTTDGSYPERWTFSEIRPGSFRWHSEETHDGGKTWILTEEMKVRKKHA